MKKLLRHILLTLILDEKHGEMFLTLAFLFIAAPYCAIEDAVDYITTLNPQAK